MKLNFYSFFVFGLILVILYPFIFLLSDKRIKISNSNNTTYKFSMKGYIGMDNVIKLAANAVNQTKIINSKYFKDEEILKFKPKKKFSVSEVISWNPDKKTNEVIPTKNLVVIKNNDIILLLGEEIIFYYDLNNLFNFFIDEFRNSNILGNDKDCSSINQSLTSMRKINYSLYEFHFDVNQKIIGINEKFKNKDEVISIYKNCFTNRANRIAYYFSEHLSNYQKFQSNNFKKDFDSFLENQNKFIFEQKQLKKLKKSILEVKDKIKKDLLNIDLNLQFIQPIGFDINKKHNKNFNMYVVSFILSILFALIIFYVLFFLKNKFKILKKIF